MIGPVASFSLPPEKLRTEKARANLVQPKTTIRDKMTQLAESLISPMPVPVSGVLKVLAIPVKFSNFENTTNLEANLVNQTLVSLASYYDEVSYQMLTLDVQTLPDWLTLPHTREHYGNDSDTEIDLNWWTFVLDSLNAANPLVNYRNYDHVLLVHAGDDEAQSGDILDLWSQASLGKQYFTYDGGTSFGFAILAEEDPYGVYAHEFGHNLDLPDLYDYSYDQTFAGAWSLMDYGNWLYPPSSLMAPEKIWLGWIQPGNTITVQNGQILNITLSPIEKSGDTLAVKIPLDYAYYVIEYRREMMTDSALPMEGVIASFVDESIGSGSGPVKVVDAEQSSTTLRDAAFTSGTGFANSNNEVGLKVLSLNGENASIRVQRGFADLVAERIQFSGEMLQGENVSFAVFIKNDGITDSENSWVSLRMNGSEFQRKELATLTPGSETVLEFRTWQAEAGLNQLEVKVDVNDDVYEKNKTNNVVSAFLDVPEHYVSIDQATVNRQRVDVNSTRQAYFHAKWSDNASDIADCTLYINGSTCLTNSTGWATLDATSSVTANLSWIVTGVDIGGFHAFKQEALAPWIVWDALQTYDYGLSKERCDVNSSQMIWVKMQYAYDQSIFDSSTGSLWIGGRPAEWDVQNSYWVITVSEPDVGLSDYTVPSSFEDRLFGLTSLIDPRQASIIWDMINLVVVVKNQRIDVGSTAQIETMGSYAFDSTVWNGNAVLNDTFTKNDGGRFAYAVTSVSDPSYGLSIFESNVVSMVFDRVVLNVTVADTRINVRETGNVNVVGSYQFDETTWEGSFALNDTLTKAEVGSHGFTVTSITDPKYNLTVFSGNSVSIVWDRVSFVLSSSKDRVSVGTEAPIVWTGKYEYDQTVFDGNVTLNANVVQNSVEQANYRIEDISDALYGLSNFASNEVTVIFDLLNCHIEADRSLIGRVLVEVDVAYQFDGNAVTDANVTVGGVKAKEIGNGRYEATVSEWKPYGACSVRVEKESFVKNVDVAFVLTGNIAVMLLAAVIIAIAVVFVRFRKLGTKS